MYPLSAKVVESVYIPISDPGDAGELYYNTMDDTVTTVVRTDALQRLCYEHQKEDGWTPDRSMRRVAHIELNTVKLLALQKGDSDAYSYLYENDARARDRMIRRYPHLFKACSGGI